MWIFRLSFIYLNILFFVQAKHKETGRLAALKQVEIKDEEELSDYMVEIDILSECRHKNVVSLYEAFFWEDKLWVSVM